MLVGSEDTVKGKSAAFGRGTNGHPAGPDVEDILVGTAMGTTVPTKTNRLSAAYKNVRLKNTENPGRCCLLLRL
jgi:hypothetical protein